ncbi:MAG TPA: class I SAM-dependent methyltransferase [Acidimicrobiales bacterium]
MITDEAVERYAEAHTTPPPPHLVRADEDTRATLRAPGMMVGPLEGRFLELLVYARGAARVLEIGTFSGYSALAMAAGLAAGGRITTCEVDPVHAEAAQRHIDDSPYADRIEIKLGPALSTIGELEGPFDVVFIDADKTNYAGYLDAVLPKLADRGVVAVDNTLWSGRVVADGAGGDDADTAALRAFNERVRADPALVAVMLPVRDGVTLIRKA